ncbi:MAG: PDZ domain-containing protein [Nitrososphaeraceae archaeon]
MSSSSLFPKFNTSHTVPKAWLGLELIDISPKISKMLQLKQEAGRFLITDVILDSPAAKAGVHGGKNVTMIDWDGIKSGGDILIKVDDKTFANASNLTYYIQTQKKVGDDIGLTIFQDGKIKQINTTLTTRPDFLTYDNADYGIKIQYPSIWIKLERGIESDEVIVSPDIVAFNSLDKVLPEELVVKVERVNLTLGEYSNTTIKKITENLTDSKIIESTETTLAGSPAHKVIAIFKERNQYETYLINIWTIKDGKVYEIRYLSDPKRYHNCLPVAEKMIRSFEIISSTRYP